MAGKEQFLIRFCIALVMIKPEINYNHLCLSYMNKLSILFCCAIGLLFCQNLKAGEVEAKPDKYVIHVELKDSTLLVNLSLEASAKGERGRPFVLFNRYIQIREAVLDDAPLNYSRSNDTLYFGVPAKSDMRLRMQYEIPCSEFGYTKLVSALGDSVYAYPVLFDTNQIFFERFNKWYPVLYDNFANYHVTVAVPETYRVFGYYPETDYRISSGQGLYSFDCFDEDFPFLITRTDVFRQHKVIQHDRTRFDFYFLPRNRRLLALVEDKPLFASDSIQIDSLLNVMMNRSVAAFDWYNANLWKQSVDNLNFVETAIFGLGACLGHFVVMDRSLMNMEAIEKYAISHEISHIWLGIHTEYLAKGKFFIGETIPEYINLLFYESWAGEAAFNEAIRDKVNLKLSGAPFYTVTLEQVLNQRKGSQQANDVIYHKGVAFVNEFRKRIGKEKLLKIVRETYSVPDHFVTLTDLENSIKANNCWEEYKALFELEL